MIIKTKEIRLKNDKSAFFRAATTSEALDLLHLVNDCSIETEFMLRSPGETDLTDIKAEERWISSVNENPKEFMFCAYIDGELAGNTGISLPHDLKKEMHRCILGIGLRKKFWNLGLGTEMIKYVEENAKNLGFEQLELDVFSTNERALHVYKKLGFVETGITPHGYKLSTGNYADKIYMIKFL